MKQLAFVSLITAGLMISGMSAQEVNKRQENQQDRIAQGVNSGQLTPHETANIERREGRINREIARDREKNGGTLTNKERRRINRQQNRLSRRIYRDKHNRRHQ
jgi:hypothetical protein